MTEQDCIDSQRYSPLQLHYLHASCATYCLHFLWIPQTVWNIAKQFLTEVQQQKMLFFRFAAVFMDGLSGTKQICKLVWYAALLHVPPRVGSKEFDCCAQNGL